MLPQLGLQAHIFRCFQQFWPHIFGVASPKTSPIEQMIRTCVKLHYTGKVLVSTEDAQMTWNGVFMCLNAYLHKILDQKEPTRSTLNHQNISEARSIFGGSDSKPPNMLRDFLGHSVWMFFFPQTRMILAQSENRRAVASHLCPWVRQQQHKTTPSLFLT